jgi:hypothetical protein
MGEVWRSLYSVWGGALSCSGMVWAWLSAQSKTRLESNRAPPFHCNNHPSRLRISRLWLAVRWSQVTSYIQPIITFDLHFISDLLVHTRYHSELSFAPNDSVTLCCSDENFIITLCEDQKWALPISREGWWLCLVTGFSMLCCCE